MARVMNIAESILSAIKILTIAYCPMPISAESAKGRISPKLNG
jgi:hypothetical protein